MKQSLAISFLSLLGLFFFAGSMQAAEALPTSRCVTAATKATHAKIIAQLEKDIAPYIKTADVETAIKKYREGVGMAWQALEEPYCGYGSYGASSAIKSYTKSVNRMRAAFLDQVKAASKTKVVSASVEKKTAEELKQKDKQQAKKQNLGRVISSGFRRGMRNDNVKLVQEVLANYFSLPADDSLVTGFFGPKTEGLIIKFQLEKKIIASEDAPGAGLVGPKTSAALNKLVQ